MLRQLGAAALTPVRLGDTGGREDLRAICALCVRPLLGGLRVVSSRRLQHCPWLLPWSLVVVPLRRAELVIMSFALKIASEHFHHHDNVGIRLLDDFDPASWVPVDLRFEMDLVTGGQVGPGVEKFLAGSLIAPVIIGTREQPADLSVVREQIRNASALSDDDTHHRIGVIRRAGIMKVTGEHEAAVAMDDEVHPAANGDWAFEHDVPMRGDRARQRLSVQLEGSGGRCPVDRPALEAVEAATGCVRLVGDRVSEKAAFPTQAGPLVADGTVHLERSGGDGPVDRPALEVVVAATTIDVAGPAGQRAT